MGKARESQSELRCTLKLRIAPGAKRSEVAGPFGDAIKIKVAAPPVDGKANEALLDYVSEKLGLPRRDVTLLSGQTSRDKVIAVNGLDQSAALARLLGVDS